MRPIQFSDDERAIVAGMRGEGCTLKEIAAALRCTVKRVWLEVHRGDAKPKRTVSSIPIAPNRPCLRCKTTLVAGWGYCKPCRPYAMRAIEGA